MPWQACVKRLSPSITHRRGLSALALHRKGNKNVGYYLMPWNVPRPQNFKI